MKTKILATAVVLAAIYAVPATAGTLYLPLASEQTIDGELHRTLVWATNPSPAPKTFSMRFIPLGQTGKNITATQSHTVPPGWSSPYAATTSGIGMLEITGPDELVFLGEMNSFDAAGRLIASTEIPFVGSRNVVGSGDTAHLLALEREIAGSRTDLGIDNLGTGAANCTIRTFRADGSQILSTVAVAVPALGQRIFPDAFGILNEASIDGGRFEVSCDQAFFAWAAVFGQFPDFVKFVVPSSGGMPASGAPDPGPAPGPAPTAGVILQRQGVFFAPSKQDSAMSIPLPIAAGTTYRSVTIEFDVYTAKFPTNLYISTVALLRPVRGGTFFAHTIRGDKGKSILDMGIGDSLVHRGENGIWQGRTNYSVRIDYDGEARQIVWRVFFGNQLIERIDGKARFGALYHEGEGIVLNLGQAKVYDDAFFPPWDFKFSNLVVRGNPLDQ